MRWFMISLDYQVSMNDVEAHLPAHRDFLQRYYADGTFLLSGRKVPRTGGLILARANDKAAIDAIIQQDPFHQQGIARFTVIEFEPTQHHAALTQLMG